jgi:hypothetical protein
MKKKLFLVFFVAISLSMFMACDGSLASTSTSLRGTWKSVEVTTVEDVEITTTSTLVLSDATFTMTNEISNTSFSITTSMEGTYSYTDTTITTTTTSLTMFGNTYTGDDLVSAMGEESVINTTNYTITKNGSVVTLTIEEQNYTKQ